MRIRFAFMSAVLVLTYSAQSYSQEPRLKLPSFKHLQDKATDSVDVTIGRWPLSLAAKFVDDNTEDSAAAKNLLSGLEAIYVRSYSFDRDNVYAKSDLDAVRTQLKAPGWNPIANVRNSGQNSNVDIYVSMDGDQPNGLAIVAAEPREFTIINIVGKVSPSDLSKLERQWPLHDLAHHHIVVE